MRKVIILSLCTCLLLLSLILCSKAPDIKEIERVDLKQTQFSHRLSTLAHAKWQTRNELEQLLKECISFDLKGHPMPRGIPYADYEKFDVVCFILDNDYGAYKPSWQATGNVLPQILGKPPEQDQSTILSWRLVAGFSKSNKLCQWWYVYLQK